ncbi:DUF4384 domain-containing protein [Pseudophaeobacter sp.]|uniref:DUF4384 domain-containing protein n=1 Tax=Pseudophaeobacter sp. TaxID=1971739 RepID=UPI003299D6E9
MKPQPNIPAPDALKSGGALWVLGLGGSACLHLAVLAALIPFLDPDPVPQQPSPQSALSMESQQVVRSRAQEQAANPDPSKQVPAQGESLDAGTVRETTARASPPALQPVAAASALGDQIASLAASGTVASAQTPEPQVSPALGAPQQSLPARPAPTQPLAAQNPDLPSAQAQVPSLLEVSLTAPRSNTANYVPTQAHAEVAQPKPAETRPLLSVVTNPQPTPEIQPNSDAITAALAFQGDATKDLDPASIAAFQSFTRPGDPNSQAAGLRDGLAGLLGAVPCSRLQVVFDPETARLELRGHLPEDGLRQPVLAALQAQMGRDIAVSDKMRLLPRPQCGALSGISNVGLPQSTDQITNPLLLGADAQARVLGYSGGEQLYFDLTAPDYPAYLYVDYFDAAGDVIHLSPNAHIPLKLAAPKSAQRVGAKTPEDPGLQITVGPPYGQEIAVAFAASSPLYDTQRPLSEPAAPYLDFLRSRVAEKRVQDTDFKGEWVYFLIETRAN